MKENILFYLVILTACTHPQKQNPAGDLQKLGSILPTANWQVINRTDTSYIYFSRQFDNTFKTYEYKLIDGDSGAVWHGSIATSDDSIVWDWNHHSLLLAAVSDSKANWKEKNSDENYVLQKINDSSLQLRSPSGQVSFTRTLPLSTFLVRAKYDYEHGTKLLDSTEVPPRKLIPLK